MNELTSPDDDLVINTPTDMKPKISGENSSKSNEETWFRNLFMFPPIHFNLPSQELSQIPQTSSNQYHSDESSVIHTLFFLKKNIHFNRQQREN